jgi:hypothetical protein
LASSASPYLVKFGDTSSSLYLISFKLSYGNFTPITCKEDHEKIEYYSINDYKLKINSNKTQFITINRGIGEVCKYFTSERALIIFQSFLAMPGGVTATRDC